jgi:RHS repeat-associated protein
MTIKENELAAMRFKRMDYKYDLISGNVHDVTYQGGHEDAMHHHYRYDADNRITDVYTSTEPYPLADFYEEGVGWTADASYSYYQHGPLARVQLGEQQVQGIDYAYTLQGWLKGVNSEDLQAPKDMGGDGKQGGVNQWVGSDAFSFSLGYFEGDYQRIDGNAADWQGPSNGTLIANRHDLWNGNIGHMISNIAVATVVTPDADDIVGKLGMSYKYDQLNRIMQAKGSTEAAGVWTPIANDAYFNAFTYDENGNILTQKRKDHSGALIDDLTYHYHKIQGVLLQNRLYHVEDASGALGSGGIGATTPVNLVGGNVDINNNNYRYTEIGELKSDAQELIENIIWRADSKIAEIRFFSSSGKDNLKFEYDVTGNRIAKYVYIGQSQILRKVTFYVRDLGGNVMAVYQHDLETPESYHLAERHIYGSSRVGMITEKVEFEYVYGNQPSEALIETLSFEETVNFELEYTIGEKQYELSNHLGNVLAVISDWKVPVTAEGSILGYTPIVVSAQDYSPFGVTLSGRSWTRKYRYGFQGQENDPNIKSQGNSWNFKYRMHDPRLGRFFAVDPLTSKYPWNSPFAFSENMVIANVEVEGLEQEYYLLKFKNDGTPQLLIYKIEDCWYLFGADVKSVEVPELGLTYTFTVAGSGGDPYCAGCGNGNNLDQFMEFAKDPLAAINSGKFRTDQEIFSEMAQELVLALILKRAIKTGTTYKPQRLKQDSDLGPNKKAPAALPTQGRKIGSNANQNRALEERIKEIKEKGATDIRVDQQQVDVNGNHVGINRPDLQYTLDGKRYYVEWDTPSSGRGAGHQARIMANDPNGKVELNILE